MHGLKEIVTMNREAMEVYEAKKLGIVPMGKSLGTCLTERELSLLKKAKADGNTVCKA